MQVQTSNVQGGIIKELASDAHVVTHETLEGLALAHPDPVDVHYSPGLVTRHVPKAEDKVGLISGGGFRHESLRAGFVDESMLDVAVPGAVFTSPIPDPILEVTKAADHGAGAPHIVKNYTSDILNFETTAELADMGDIRVSLVIINDDMTVGDSLYTAGRHGIAEAIFAEEIAGAAAKHDNPLEEVTRIATKINDQTRSMGLALGPCMVPHTDKPSFDLGEDEVELDIGTHGEPGYRRDAVETADSPVAELYERVREGLGPAEGERVTALINDMGGTPVSELYIYLRALATLSREDGIKIVCQMIGNYAASLEMPGISVTFIYADDELLELFDVSVSTVAWK